MTFTMSPFSLLFEILYISSHIHRAIGHSVLSPYKSDPSEGQIIGSFDIPPSETVHRAGCRTNNSRRIQTTSGKADTSYRWNKGFFVQLDKEFDQNEVQIINSALNELRKVLCIPVKVFSQSSRPTGDFTFIQKGLNDLAGACFSDEVGRRGGMQLINLGVDGCIDKGTIVHECIHALGFDHEQNRPDRDDYVDIFYENMQEGESPQFDIATGSLTFNLPYDYKSIMHYESTAFSQEGDPTILKKDGGRIRRNEELSTIDKQKLKAMYKCKKN